MSFAELDILVATLIRKDERVVAEEARSIKI